MYIGFLSGDERMRVAARLAAKAGHRAVLADNLSEAAYLIENADLLVLPIPVTRDGEHLTASDIPISALRPRKGLRLAGGGLPPTLRASFAASPVIDFLEEEDFLLHNARLTAEGGIATALGATGRGFFRLSAAVFGFGRIGRQVARLLYGMGIPVTVYARRREVLAEIEALGYRARPLSVPLSVKEPLVFGTVPAAVYGGVRLRTDAVAIDLGGGMPTALPHDGGEVKVIAARGVPGVFAPLAAGELVYESLSVLLSEETS